MLCVNDSMGRARVQQDGMEKLARKHARRKNMVKIARKIVCVKMVDIATRSTVTAPVHQAISEKSKPNYLK